MINKRRIIREKRLFKKNQIIIATLAVMIAVSGYLNFSGEFFWEKADGPAEGNSDPGDQGLLDIFPGDIEAGTEEH